MIAGVEPVQFGQAVLLHQPAAVGRALQGVVMHDHHLTVAAQMHVQLHIHDPQGGGPLERGQGIFRGFATGAPVGEQPWGRTAKKLAHVLLLTQTRRVSVLAQPSGLCERQRRPKLARELASSPLLPSGKRDTEYSNVPPDADSGKALSVTLPTPSVNRRKRD